MKAQFYQGLEKNRSIYLGNKMSEKSNLNKERARLDYEDGEVMAT